MMEITRVGRVESGVPVLSRSTLKYQVVFPLSIAEEVIRPRKIIESVGTVDWICVS